MDTGTAIIVVIIITICILPFILLIRGRKMKEKQLLSYISSIAQQHQSKLTQYEFCSDFIIGLDEIASRVFFLKKRNDTVTSKQINFTNIDNCKVIRTLKTKNSNDRNYQEIDKLELCFTPITKYHPDIFLELYNSNERMQLGIELPLIEKWSKIVNIKIMELKTVG